MRSRMSVIVLVVVAAASAGGDSSRLSSGDDYSVRGALAELPTAAVGDELTEIRTADLSAATELLELERPAAADFEAVWEWLAPLTGVASGGVADPEFAPLFLPLGEVFNYPQLREIAEFDEALGWSLVDVDAYVEYSTLPRTFAVVTGDFDDATLSPELVELSDGIVSYGDGDDGEVNPEASNAVDRLGRPLRLAQDGDRIAASLMTSLVTEWVAGPDETLADDDALSSVAAALDDADVVAAVLTSVEGGLENIGGGRLTPVQLEQIEQLVEQQVPAAPYDAVGFGWGIDAGEAMITVAYHFSSDDEASDAVDSFELLYTEGNSLVSRQPISDLVTLEDVTVDGDIVSVSLTLPAGSRPQIIYQMHIQRDLPFVSR
jgi:hypothetical protein